LNNGTTARLTPRVDVSEQKPNGRQALLEGPILRTLIRLALPTLLVLIAQTAVNVVEALYVGLLGTPALAGVALVFPAYMLMVMMSAGGIGSGVGSAVSRAIGAGRKADADALLTHALVLAALAGAFFTLALFFGGEAYFRALGGQGEALRAALTYSHVLFSSAIAVWIVNLLAAALRASGNVKVPAAVTLIGALITIPVSPALIFGFGPIPRLGIAGAALAFSLYNSIAALALLRYTRSSAASVELKLTPLEWRHFADILQVGVPAAFNTLQSNLTVIVVTGAVGVFGTGALAGYGIASRLDYILIPILFGLSSGVMTMVGVNAGAGQFARAKRITWVGCAIGAVLTGLIGSTVSIDPGLWLHFFSHDPGVLATGATYLHIVAPFYGLFGLGFVITFASQGTGHVLWPSIGTTARMAVAAGLGSIAVRHFGAGMTGLSLFVAASLCTYALSCLVVMLSSAIWAPKPSRGLRKP
jgi:putative MATE family efflux protein